MKPLNNTNPRKRVLKMKPSDVGSYVKKIREELKLSRTQLASMSGTSRQSIYNVEMKNSFSMEMIEAIFSAFGKEITILAE